MGRGKGEMTDKQIKQAALVALLIWWLWPKPQADVTAQIKTDPDFYPSADWRDIVFY
jgi:hypothetical protein